MEAENKIAQIISILFHPLLMPFLGVFLLFQADTYISYMVASETQKLIYFLVLLNTFAFPALLILFLYNRKVISSLSLEEKSERTWPFIISAIFFYFTYYLISSLVLPKILSAMLLGAFVATLLAIVITLFFKISIHMIGISGLIGGFMAFSVFYETPVIGLLAILILLSGVIAYARLTLHAHKSNEIYWGFFVGFIAEFATVYLLLD